MGTRPGVGMRIRGPRDGDGRGFDPGPPGLVRLDGARLGGLLRAGGLEGGLDGAGAGATVPSHTVTSPDGVLTPMFDTGDGVGFGSGGGGFAVTVTDSIDAACCAAM